MAYIRFGNKISKFGNNIYNSGESFILKVVGATFTKGSGSVQFRLTSNSPVTVNYGDGSVINLTPSLNSGSYLLSFSSTSNLHTYADGLDVNRDISFSFDRSKLILLNIVNQQLQVADFLFEFSKYPNLETFNIQNTSILNLNVEGVTGSKIKTLGIAQIFNSMSRLYKLLPIEVFSMPLISLSFGTTGGFHTVPFSSSNTDKVYLLASTLTTLSITARFADNNFGDGALPSNFNQLINLTSLSIDQSNYTTIPPVINQIPSLTLLSLTQSSTVSSYGDISNLINLITLSFQASANVPDNIPVYFSGLTKLKTMNHASCFLTQIRIDNFVDNMYSFVTSNATISGANSLPFRGMTMRINTYITPPPPPSGIYQQPSGYVAGISNGTPASQKEKIWVMVNQYGHVWTTN